MRKALLAVPGVQRVEVEFEKDLAIVHHDGADQAAMVSAIEGEGFKSWPTSTERKPDSK